jgi:hypothetical protein
MAPRRRRGHQTLKLRRTNIAAKYAAEIDALYA